MPSVRRYLAVADQAPGESAFSITFPALPGLTSVALCDADIESQARDALATVAEAFLEDARPCCRASKAMHCRLSTESAFTTRGGFSWLSTRGIAGENLPPCAYRPTLAEFRGLSSVGVIRPVKPQ